METRKVKTLQKKQGIALILKDAKSSGKNLKQAQKKPHLVTHAKRNKLDSELALAYAHAIVTSTEDPLVVLNRRLHMEYANPSFYKKFNIPKSGVLGIPFTHIGNGQFNDKKLKSALHEVCRDQKEFRNFEFIFDFPKLGERVLHLTARTIPEPHANDSLILLTITDTAAQKRKRIRSESLYAERTRFHELLMQAPALITVLQGSDLIHDFVNPKFTNAIGVHRNILGKSIKKSIPELSGQGFFEILENVYKTGKPYIATEKLLRIDKKGSGVSENLYLNVMCQSYRNEENEIDGVLVYAVDVTEQYNIRKSNKESEEKYRILLNSIHEGYAIAEIIFDDHEIPIDLEFIEMNSACKRILNISESNIHRLSSTPSLMDTSLLKNAGDVGTSHKAKRFTIVDSDSKMTHEVYCSKMESSRKKIVALVIKSKNEQHEKLLTVIEKNVSAFHPADNSADGIIIVDTKGRISFVNETAKNILRPVQISGIEFLEHNLLETFPSLLSTDLEKKFHKAFIDQKTVRVEMFYKPLTKWFELCIQPFHDHVSLFFIDITERKINEEKLLNAKFKAHVTDKNLSDLFTNLPAIIAIFSADDLVFEMANVAFRNFVGFNHALDGLSIVEAFPQIDPLIVKIIVNVIKKAKPFTANEFPLMYDWDSNGKAYKKFLNITLEPLFNENRKVTGVICFGHEVTEQVTSKEQLEEVNRSKDIFISIASHELKTPVTSIKAYTQILERRFNKKGDADSALVIGKMDNQLDKLNTLITNLLDVTKIEEGKLILSGLCFNFNVLVEEIIEEMQLTTKKHIVPKLQKGAFVCGDRERIGQVMINFISNAIKYSPGAKEIIVSTVKKNDEIIFSVKDFGMGIEKSEQKKVFERFHRISRKNGETYPGLGLGLYIASQIIARLNGKIWLKSLVKKGSTFYFSLPAEKNLF